MDRVLIDIFADGAVIQVAALLGAALFFMTVGFIEARHEHPEGYLYLAISLFFVSAHVACLLNLPTHLSATGKLTDFNAWTWLALLLAPALIAVYLLRSLFDFVVSQNRKGLVKMFFGLTLLCYLYMLGAHWPLDVRGIMTLIWLSLFFKLELGLVRE
ncbi:MAG: hypothetical protein GY867_00640 [bacterium]|nr:hypothetical protein [bacterium]